MDFPNLLKVLLLGLLSYFLLTQSTLLFNETSPVNALCIILYTCISTSCKGIMCMFIPQVTVPTVPLCYSQGISNLATNRNQYPPPLDYAHQGSLHAGQPNIINQPTLMSERGQNLPSNAGFYGGYLSMVMISAHFCATLKVNRYWNIDVLKYI